MSSDSVGKMSEYPCQIWFQNGTGNLKKPLGFEAHQPYDIGCNFQYFGLWYEQQRYFAAFELGLSCVTAEYSLLPDGNVKVNNTGIKG